MGLLEFGLFSACILLVNLIIISISLNSAEKKIYLHLETLDERIGGLGRHFGQHKCAAEHDIAKALSKSEVSFQVAHQALTSVKDSKTFTVKLDPFKVRIRHPKNTGLGNV